MSDERAKEIFSRNLRRYMELKEKTQADMARDLHVSTATASDWCNRKKMPRSGILYRYIFRQIPPFCGFYRTYSATFGRFYATIMQPKKAPSAAAATPGGVGEKNEKSNVIF